MRVLFVAGWYPSSQAPGRGSFVADQVRAVVARGVEVVVASWEPALLVGDDDPDAVAVAWGRAIERGPLPLATPSAWGAGVPVTRLPAVVPGSPELRLPTDLARWQAATLVPFGRALLRDWPFDVIHAHRGIPDAVAAVALAEDVARPILTTEHDGSLDRRLATPAAAAAYRSLVGDRRRLVAVSRHLADQAAELAGIPRTSIEVIPNLVDREVFRPRPDIPRDPDELLWVGNRKTSKGIDTLIEAMARLAIDRPVRLRLIGQAPTEAEDRRLEALAADLGVADRIGFEPAASRDGVAAAMAHAGLFVHPSPSESFGVVAVEALASGLPVVAVAPAIVELIGRDGALGEVADGPDAAALAAAIDRALAREADFDRDAIVRASAPFGADRVAEAIVARYASLAAGAPGPGTTTATTSLRRGEGPGPALVVAMRRRSAIDRLDRLPLTARASLSVVTATGDGARPAGWAGWEEVDPDAAFRSRMAGLAPGGAGTPNTAGIRRLAVIARHPINWAKRRRLVARRPALAAAARASAVARVARGLAPATTIVALDADDVAVIRQAGLESRLGPGMVWWLADRSDEAAGNDDSKRA